MNELEVQVLRDVLCQIEPLVPKLMAWGDREIVRAFLALIRGVIRHAEARLERVCSEPSQLVIVATRITNEPNNSSS